MSLTRLVAGTALATMVAGALADPYPSHPVRIVVGTAPGGGPDVLARFLADRLSGAFTQPFVVENKSGANGNIAGDFVARSKPDGHTLLLVPDSVITINPHVYGKNMPFDTLKQLVPVASVASSQFFLTVNPGIPAKTLPELIHYARNAQPPLRYASAGMGSQHHLGIEMLKQVAGIDLLHVPYRGGAPAGMATVTGETHVVLAGTGSAALIQSGKLRALATTGAKRSALLPQTPPIGEFYPSYDLTIWQGVFAPAGTPEPTLSKVRAEIQRALAEPDLARKINASGGMEPLFLSSAQFTAMIRRDYEKYGKLVQDLGVRID